MAIVGIRKYGKQYGVIAEIIGSKTEAQVRTFFVNYRKKYNLDELVKEYETQLKINEQKDSDANDIKQHEPEIMEVSWWINDQWKRVANKDFQLCSQIDLDEENPNSRDDEDIEEVSQSTLKALTEV